MGDMHDHDVPDLPETPTRAEDSEHVTPPPGYRETARGLWTDLRKLGYGRARTVHTIYLLIYWSSWKYRHCKHPEQMAACDLADRRHRS